MPNVFIDTELWIYSLKKPDQLKYEDSHRFQLDMEKHVNAKIFFRDLPTDNKIFFTIEQLCENYHNLRFRGSCLEPKFVNDFILALTSSPASKIVEVSRELYEKCIRLSTQANIHIWDFLCVIPLCGKIDLIYTTDKHFLNSSFGDLGIPIQNPLKDWDII
jgi:predicted nucleic acid-binding protein